MTPKERMICVFNHEEPDRVPLGEHTIMFKVAEKVLGHPTLHHSPYGERLAEWEGRRDDIVRAYSEDFVGLVHKLDLDFLAARIVPPRNLKPEMPEMIGEHTWRDKVGRIWQYSPESGATPRVLKNVDFTLDDIEMPPNPAPFDPSRVEAIANVVREIGSTHMVIGDCPYGYWPWRQTVGFEEYLMRMLDWPEFVEKSIEAATRGEVAAINAMCDAGVDAIWECVDLCGNLGPLLSPELFRKFLKPALQRLVDAAHARGKWYIKHSDGLMWPLLDDIVEVGADAYHGIQPRVGMDMRKLKQRYGKKLVLIGGVDEDTLEAGTVGDVVAQVRYALEHAAPGGGFVLASGNTIGNDVKWDNFLAMQSTGRRLGTYPIRLDQA